MTFPILVASSTGKVGRDVVKRLIEINVSFRAATSSQERAQQLFGDSVPIVVMDYSQTETFAPALQGIKGLFFLSPADRPGLFEPLSHFVDDAVRAGVERVVFMSALGCNEHPDDTMYRVEQHIAKSGMEYTILRPNWFMQNFNITDLRDINEKHELVLPAGDSPFSFIDTRDIAEVAVHILLNRGHHGKAYTLTGDETFTYGEVAERISKIAGRKITHISRPAESVLQDMRDHNAPEEFVEVMAWIYADMRRGLTAKVSGDVQAILGRPPRKFAQYLQDFAHVWRV